MNILGINGLGINPAACLLQNNTLMAFAAEERFTRKKDSFGAMPANASAFCLNSNQLELKDIDTIAFGWNAPMYTLQMPLFALKTALTSKATLGDPGNIYKALEQLIKYRPANVKRMIAEMNRVGGLGGELPPVYFTSHHLAHAASAYYTSGFEESHILVIDGSGENQCTTIFKAKGLEIKQLKTFYIPHSLGWFYQSITEWLGFSPNSHEGKTMALAAYGKEDAAITAMLTQIIQQKSNADYTYDSSFSFSGKHVTGNIYSDKLTKLLGNARKKNAPITDYHRNVAYATQKTLETFVSRIVEGIVCDKDFNGNLCLAGGVTLNCKMNGAIAELEGVKNIFVSPVSSDDGTALGAAMLCAKSKNIDPRFEMNHAYYGPSYSDEAIEAVLKRTKIKYKKSSTICYDTAQMLVAGKVVGWFQGAMEVGPRALGNRSILANPLIENIKDTVNNNVKGREAWRPFAASILFEDSSYFVENARPSAFMNVAFSVKKDARHNIISAMHTDNTIRPQFVTKSANPLYYQLIQEFGYLTGVNALLNTSLNTNEEPMVCTPEQAIKAFFGSGMDALVIGNYILQKH